MAVIPFVQTTDRNINQLQTNIISALQPLLLGGILDGTVLTNVSLVSGSNAVPHGLNRKLQGWIIVRQRAAATVYDTQDNNPNPTSTLLLTSSAGVVVDLYVF
jgi:hypothetical protein